MTEVNDIIAKTTKASGVPLKVSDSGVLAIVAGMLRAAERGSH